MSGKCIMIAEVESINNLLAMNPLIPIHKSNNESHFDITSFLMSKSLNDHMKNLLRKK